MVDTTVSTSTSKTDAARRALLTQTQRDNEDRVFSGQNTNGVNGTNFNGVNNGVNVNNGYNGSTLNAPTFVPLYGLYVSTGNDNALVDLVDHIAAFWRNERNLRAEGNKSSFTVDQIAAAKVAINQIFDSTQLPTSVVNPLSQTEVSRLRTLNVQKNAIAEATQTSVAPVGTPTPVVA